MMPNIISRARSSQAGSPAEKAPVDHRAQALADAEHGQRGDHQGDGGEDDAAAMRPQQGPGDTGGVLQAGHGRPGKQVCRHCMLGAMEATWRFRLPARSRA
jgi:hypothetical protein